jgi:SAM-dependent methyltransferase
VPSASPSRPLLWRIRGHLRWRLSVWLPLLLDGRLPAALRDVILKSEPDTAEGQWLRAVMIPDTRQVFESLDPPRLHVAEISGDLWTGTPWASRTQLDFPGFDLCSPPPELPGPFDLVICEQVLEHVPDPLTAVRTLRRLCKPDGHVYVSTPFLVRLHDWPGDYWRFTPDGMAILLRSQGLEPLWVRSWGNRKVAAANFDHWVPRLAWQSLRNEPLLPVSVWALARPVAEPPPED